MFTSKRSTIEEKLNGTWMTTDVKKVEINCPHTYWVNEDYEMRSINVIPKSKSVVIEKDGSIDIGNHNE